MPYEVEQLQNTLMNALFKELPVLFYKYSEMFFLEVIKPVFPATSSITSSIWVLMLVGLLLILVLRKIR